MTIRSAVAPRRRTEVLWRGSEDVRRRLVWANAKRVRLGVGEGGKSANDRVDCVFVVLFFFWLYYIYIHLSIYL